MTFDEDQLLEVVDTLVVGGSLGGLLAAAFEARAGKKVVLLEASSGLGGRWSPEFRDGFQLGAGLCFAHKEASTRICENIGIDCELIHIENGGCLLASRKGWKKIHTFPSWEAYFSRTVESVPKGGIAGIIKKIVTANTFRIYAEHPVTELFVEEEKGKYARVRDKKISFKECVWASSETALMDVLSGEQVPKQGSSRSLWMKRFIMNNPCPGIVLEFAHDKLVGEFTETLAFPFSDSSPNEDYIIGSFISNRDTSLAPKGKQLSSWVLSLGEQKFLLDKDNNHEIMKRINLSKRVLERYFPGFKNSVIFHRVQVLNHIAEPIEKRKVSKDRIFSNVWSVADWSSPIGGNFEGIISQVLERGSSLSKMLS